MVFSRHISLKGPSKEPPPPAIKMVSKLSPTPPDAPTSVSEDFTTVATFNMLSNMGRDIILRGAPPSIGRLVPTRRPSLASNSASSSGSWSPASSAGATPLTTSSFLSSGLPSAERTYPVLALLEILRHTNQHHTIIDDGLDVIADAGSLAQILRYQRESASGGSSPVSSSPSTTTTSSLGSGSTKKTKKSRTLSFNTSSKQQQQQQQQQQQPPPSNTELRLHALLHENTLLLFSDLYLALNHLDDSPETRESRLKGAVSTLTHSPLLGSHEHRRAIRYDAGGLSFLVHFSAYASTAAYPANQPFLPVSHSLREFAGSKIDYHMIPDAVQLPLQHDLLVHCTFDGETDQDRKLAVDEMTFCRVEKLMEVGEGPYLGKGREPMQARNVGVKPVDTDLSNGAALVVPFLKQLKEEMKAKRSSMVLLQQLDNDEVLVVEDTEPLIALAEALKNYGAPFGTQ